MPNYFNGDLKLQLVVHLQRKDDCATFYLPEESFHFGKVADDISVSVHTYLCSYLYSYLCSYRTYACVRALGVRPSVLTSCSGRYSASPRSICQTSSHRRWVRNLSLLPKPLLNVMLPHTPALLLLCYLLYYVLSWFPQSVYIGVKLRMSDSIRQFSHLAEAIGCGVATLPDAKGLFRSQNKSSFYLLVALKAPLILISISNNITIIKLLTILSF